jgi:hypothetical protein
MHFSEERLRNESDPEDSYFYKTILREFVIRRRKRALHSNQRRLVRD